MALSAEQQGMVDLFKGNISSAFSNFVTEEDKQFVVDTTLELGVLYTDLKFGTPQQQKSAQEAIDDLVLTLQTRAARKEIKLRRGMSQVFGATVQLLGGLLKSLI